MQMVMRGSPTQFLIERLFALWGADHARGDRRLILRRTKVEGSGENSL